MFKALRHPRMLMLMVFCLAALWGCGGDEGDLIAPELTLDSLQSQNANTTGTAIFKVAGGALDLSGTVEPGALVEVEVNAADPVLADVSGGDWSYTLPNASLSEGVNTIVVSAEDASGNKRSLSFFVTRDTTGPEVTLDQFVTPATTGDQIIGGTVEVGAQVEIFVDGVSDGLATVSGGIWTRSLSGLADGVTYSVSASATDALGNISETPATQNIAISSTAPLVSIDPIPPTTADSVTVTGSRQSGVVPVITSIGSTATVGSADLAEPATWIVGFQGLVSGANVLSVVVGTAGGSAEARAIVHRDLSGPAVIANTPAHGAFSVPLDEAPSITFSEDLDESVITDVETSHITLVDAAGTSVAGSIAYDGPTRVATFTPDAPLASGTSYTATVLLSVADTLGNLLGTNYSWKFTTE